MLTKKEGGFDWHALVKRNRVPGFYGVPLCSTERFVSWAPPPVAARPMVVAKRARKRCAVPPCLRSSGGPVSTLFGTPSSNRQPNPTLRKLCASYARACRDACRVSLSATRFRWFSAATTLAPIGTWSGVAAAVRARGPLGLIWIDAHMDAHTPATSPSGALHGMPLACLLGHGEASLVALMKGHALDPGHVCLVGVRSFEPDEAELLSRLGVRVFSMDEIDQRGLGEVMADAHAIATHGTAGFGITIDLDVIDPAEAPGVGTPVPWGLESAALAHALAAVSGDPRLVAAEIAEYNPRADSEAHTTGVAAQLATAVLGAAKARDDRQGVSELEWRYGAHNYDPLPVTLVRGEGVHVWDEHGRRLLDMMSAYSAVSHGHCHPRLTRVLAQQAGTLNVTSRAYRNDRLPLLFERLCEVTGQEAVLPANTGLEAVEVAIKAARKWGAKVKGVPQDEVEIIACEGNFHGRSIAILAMSSEAQYRDGFGPFPPGFVRIPFADAAALERAITPRTAAFLVEPIQGEGGIIVPPSGLPCSLRADLPTA